MRYVVLQDRALADYAASLKRLGANGPVVLAAALNETGAQVRRATVAAETKQTGLKEDTIDRAQHAIAASPYDLNYTIASRGGDIRLKFLGAKESQGGVLAHPFNQDQVFAHAFMMGGRFPNRVTISKLNGTVIERIGVRGKDKPWSRTVRSGVVIPTEMTKGQTVAAFERGVETIVATMVVRRLGDMLP